MSTPNVTTGDISAPRSDLTRGLQGWERREYADGLIAVRYYGGDIDDVSHDRVLVWERRAGLSAGYLWYRGDAVGSAVRRFRNGARSKRHWMTYCR